MKNLQKLLLIFGIIIFIILAVIVGFSEKKLETKVILEFIFNYGWACLTYELIVRINKNEL